MQTNPRLSYNKWLVSDFNNRDPQDDLHDVDCGKYLDALQDIGGTLLQLLQDNEMHVELTEFGDRYIVAKIIKKREPEFLQGQNRFFVYNDEGKRIPLEEEEFNKLLGIGCDPEDVFERSDIDLTTIGSEAIPPMDMWDVLYDATDYIRETRNLLNNDEWQTTTPANKKNEQLLKLANELIYSANWFPYSVDKRIHSSRAKDIALRIEKGVTRAQLGALIGPHDPEAETMKNITKMKLQAQRLPLGPEKGRLMVQAQRALEVIMTGRKVHRQGRQYDAICGSDRAKLWTLWREREMRVNGSVPLMSWQFEKAYRAKLLPQVNAGSLSSEQATEMLKNAMERLYHGGTKVAQVKTEVVPEMPAWLSGVEVNDNQTTWEFDSPTQQPQQVSLYDMPVMEDEEWLEQVLLSDDGGM